MLLLLACLGAEAADVHLTHQGRLLNSSGIPINGAVELELALYDSASASTPLWSDTLPSEVHNGHYAVVLGSSNPLDSALIATDELWLAASIDDLSLGPRQRVGESLRTAQALHIAGTPLASSEGARSWADGTVARSCKEYRSPAPGYAYRGDTGSGAYRIDPDGSGALATRTMYCDMTTAGGGWTILYASSGGDGEVGLASNTLAHGNPLAFGAYNVSRADKAAFATAASESLFLRSGGTYLLASEPMFTARIAFPESTYEQIDTLLTSSNGNTTTARMGWSNYNTAGGGDFGITTTAHGFDLHNATYWMLNSGCEPMYLYSYSNQSNDGDANYRVNLGLGDWSETARCTANESGSLPFYAAVR